MRIGIRIALTALFAALAPAWMPPAVAQQVETVNVASGVHYREIGRWDTDRLNAILTTETPTFAGITVAYTPARNAVRLYRITYDSVIPERGNKPTVATGLLAVPDTADTTFPMMSYQHGTVYGKQEVPSFPEQSSETKLMIAQFAGQGYVMVGADYFGLGESSEPDGYLLKASHQQATSDLLTASRAVLAHLKRKTSKLYLAGWSQGGFVTMALLEKLERDGVNVTAAATASGPPDLSVTLNGFLNFPRKNDASWTPVLFILSAFSFENYYGVPGLARSVLTDESYDVARKFYLRQLGDANAIPSDLRKVIRADYFDPEFFAASAYGRLAAQTEAYRRVIRTPLRNYYGERDEIVSNSLAQLAMNYQRAMGNGNPAVEAISTGDTDHRGTFAKAVPQWKAWFDAQ